MIIKLKNEYANEFISKLQSRYPQYSESMELGEYTLGFIISLEIMKLPSTLPLKISMSVRYNEITVGHDINDHKHFCLDEECESNFIDEALEYIDFLMNPKESTNVYTKK